MELYSPEVRELALNEGVSIAQVSMKCDTSLTSEIRVSFGTDLTNPSSLQLQQAIEEREAVCDLIG